MLRVALLSFWHVHGRDYAKDAEQHPDTELVAVWDEVPERGQAEAAQRGLRFYADLNELLAQPDIDGVIITTPTVLHRDVMVAAANAGKHIFTEKVVAATLREADEILQAVKQAGVTLMVSMWRLDEASTGAIKAILEDGRLGDITSIRVRDGHPFALPTEQFPRGRLADHFLSPEQAQGGALIDLCHPVYLTRYLMGLPESVSASFGYVTGREVEDNAVVTFRYPNGALGVVETGYVTHSSPFTIEAHGTRGSLLYSEPGIGERASRGMAQQTAGSGEGGPDGRLHIHCADSTGGAAQWVVQEVTTTAPPKAFSQWVAHIQQGTQATENVAIGTDLTALIEASNRSVATGQTVRLDALERG